MAVKAGDKVAIHYQVYGMDGNVLASTSDQSPAVLNAGGDEVIPGLSHGVIGMEVGEEKILRLLPKETFGCGSTAVIRTIARDKLPRDVEVGDRIRLSLGPTAVLLWVIESRSNDWIVSTQHPLAGQRINLRVKVVSKTNQMEPG